jgi:hypothetical protein
MARVKSDRAPARLAGVVLIAFLGSMPAIRVVSAQTSTASPPPAPTTTTTVAPTPANVPVAQPGWLGPSVPMLQVGPDGAVQLDQPMMMPANPAVGGQYYYAAQPVMAGPPQQYVPYGAPYAAPQPGYQPWGPPVVQPQPQMNWGSWFTGAQPTAAGPLPPSFVHRSSIFGEFLYIRPRDAEVAYALPIDGPVAPVLGNEVPIGPVAVVEPDYDISFRAGFNLAIDQGSSVAAEYTRLRSDATNAVTVVAPAVLRSLVSHPLGANAATDTLDAAASLDIELDQIDVDFRSLWYGCECNYAYAINYLVGAEYATLDQRFASTFVTLGTTTVNSNVEFSGIGMRFGMQGERLWPKANIFVYGTSVVNFLFGEFDASYVQANTLNGIEAVTSWSAGRIVPVVDFEFGAGWLGLNRHLRLSAGYRVSTWFNVVKTEDWIWAAQNHDFRDLDGTLTFDGLVGRAEWLF